MTDPRRLVGGTDLSATLLASAGSDSPRRRARHRVAVALGLAASIATLTSASAVTGSMNAGGRAGMAGVGGGAAGGRVGASAWLTLVGGGLVAASIAGALMLATDGAYNHRRSNEVVTVLSAATRAHEPEPTTVSEPAAAVTTRQTPWQGAVDQGRGKTSRVGADPPAESPLARELKALDGARSALDRREIGDALGALDRYERTFPNGTLRTEASLLRVEALLARGDALEARKLARDLLARDPSGPHARRLRTIVENQ